MLSIRLTGTPDEVADAVVTMRDVFPISAIKGLLSARPHQSQVRVTVEIDAPEREAAA